MKYISYILIVALAFPAVGCQDETATSKREHNDCLKVTAQMMESDWSTSTRASEAQHEDTVFQNDDIVITAQVEDIQKAFSREQQEQQEQQEQAQTRGTPLTSGGQLPSMRILMYHTGTELWEDAQDPTFDKIESKNTNGEWVIQPVVGWTESSVDYRTFFAVSPTPYADADDYGVTMPYLNDPLKLYYYVPVVAEKQPDLCWAKNIDQLNEVGSYKNLQNFTFKHALAAIGVASKGYQLAITDAKITGILTGGVFNLNDDSWTEVDTPEERVLKVIENYSNDKHDTPYTSKTATDGYLMVPPQELTDDVVLSLTYKGVDGLSEGGTISCKLNTLSAAWEAGKRVTYNVRLKTAPAVTTDALTIPTFIAGNTTSTPVPFYMASDDDLTFTWEADWLKIVRGVRKDDATGGYSSGWNTGTGGPWKDIYFFADTNNESTVSNRQATVTVTGKKSATRTFTVTQVLKELILTVNRDSYSVSYQSGTASQAITYTTNIDATVTVTTSNSVIQPTLRRTNAREGEIDITYTRNYIAREDREVTFTLTATVGVLKKTQTIKIKQASSKNWIVVDNSGKVLFAVTYKDGGYGNHNGSCSFLSRGEFMSLRNFCTNIIHRNCNMVSENRYWTSEKAPTGVFRYQKYYSYWIKNLVYNGFNLSQDANAWDVRNSYRCKTIVW